MKRFVSVLELQKDVLEIRSKRKGELPVLSSNNLE